MLAYSLSLLVCECSFSSFSLDTINQTIEKKLRFSFFFSHSPFVRFTLISFLKDRFSFSLIVLVCCSYCNVPGSFFCNALTIYIYWFVVFFRPVYISVFQFGFNCIQQQLMKSIKLTIKICDDGNDDDNNPQPKQR